MSAIIKGFKVTLTRKQAAEIRAQFRAACKAAGVEHAGMIMQPKTQCNWLATADAMPPTLEVAVISQALFTDISFLIEKHRNREGA